MPWAKGEKIGSRGGIQCPLRQTRIARRLSAKKLTTVWLEFRQRRAGELSASLTY
jgi:hypothetical protein